jgi:hypothetical protein
MGLKQVHDLLSNAAATGSAVKVGGGTYSWSLVGTIGGATVKLQVLGPDAVTYIDIPSASLSAAGVMSVDLAGGASVKAVVTGGAPSALYSGLALIRS